MTHLPNDALTAALERADRHSPFLRSLIARHSGIVSALTESGVDEALRCAAALGGGAPPGVALRRERRGVALALAIADLAGLPLEEIVTALSDFADRALDTAIRAAIEERTPGAPPEGFAAIALGKHGSRELNYSSDIDPILIFDPATLPRLAREEPIDAAVRIVRRVVELLQSLDGSVGEGGHVFRVDLRLRPSPEATPLALPIEAALSYYESSALPWERAAFIRARAAAGDIALGEGFLADIRPFVWRRTLDYGAISEIRAISHRIRDHHSKGQLLGPGYDLKRGRGGIREVEFFAQIHQLIYGGREPALRAPATLDAVAALANAGRIARADADRLVAAYRFHRTIEHRLQMVDDRQTHRLPPAPADLDNVAALHGVADGRALIDLLAPHVEAVGRIYDSLEGEEDEGLPHDPASIETVVAAAGFAEPGRVRERIELWRGGTLRALRSPAARDALESLLPGLLAAFGRAPDAMAALNRFDDLIAGLPSAVNLFRLLEARPVLARLVGDILSLAPTLAAALARQPSLLDGLIDATAFDPPGTVAGIAAELAAGEKGEDYQALLDRVRRRVGEKRFALGAQLLGGVGDPLDVATGYSRIAEGAIEVLAGAAVAEFETAHGRVPGSELTILALGRLGGGALTHASDLDLIYLFTGDYQTESDGRRPLGATLYFNRLAPRVTAALSVPTAAGALYEVDTRLRPSGAKGMLAASLDSFARYQREDAWTWEHMALTRARAVYGSPAARAALDAVVADTLRRPRDAATLLADAVKMRADMARHKPPAGPLDVKLIDGGLVDLEFCVHVAQLRHCVGLDPHLPAAIAALTAAGHLPHGFADAHDLLTRMLVTLRLVAPDLAEPEAPAKAVVARSCDAADWTALLAAYAETRQRVGAEWRRIVAEAGEQDAR